MGVSAVAVTATAGVVLVLLLEWWRDDRDRHGVDRRQRQMCISDREKAIVFYMIRRLP